MGCDSPGNYVTDSERADMLYRERDRLEAENERLRDALAELVRLKDGPKDYRYYAAKPLAWQEARDALQAGPVGAHHQVGGPYGPALTTGARSMLTDIVTIEGREVRARDSVESIEHDGSHYVIHLKPRRFATLDDAIRSTLLDDVSVEGSTMSCPGYCPADICDGG